MSHGQGAPWKRNLRPPAAATYNAVPQAVCTVARSIQFCESRHRPIARLSNTGRRDHAGDPSHRPPERELERARTLRHVVQRALQSPVDPNPPRSAPSRRRHGRATSCTSAEEAANPPPCPSLSVPVELETQEREPHPSQSISGTVGLPEQLFWLCARRRRVPGDSRGRAGRWMPCTTSWAARGLELRRRAARDVELVAREARFFLGIHRGMHGGAVAVAVRYP
ncbi:hypothetical protein F4824DRAFT_496098 [Ustulina deusta]|nr:hypothetical protein F4824DRAFT_496098 [Ustulina deusta]